MATKKLTAALLTLNEAINAGMEYPTAHEKAVSLHKLSDKQADELRDAYDTQEAAFAKSKDDPNHKYRVLEMVLGTEGTPERCRIRVYLLNPGECYAGFGGSRSGLVVRKTASLVVSTLQCGSLREVEYDLRGMPEGDTWAWLKRCILREAGVKLPDEG